MLIVQFPSETSLKAKKRSNSAEAVTAPGESGVWCMKPLKEIGSGWFDVMGDTTVTATTVRPAIHLGQGVWVVR